MKNPRMGPWGGSGAPAIRERKGTALIGPNTPSEDPPPFMGESESGQGGRSNDPVNPAHYQGDYVMRIIEDFKLDFLDGQVIKYILRAGKKDTPIAEDHKKAAWYLERKIKNLGRVE